MDEEIKKRFQTTLERFMQDYPYPHERYKIKGKILKDLINEYEDIVYTRRIFKKIKNKYFINNQSVNKVVDDLIVIIKNIIMNK